MELSAREKALLELLKERMSENFTLRAKKDSLKRMLDVINAIFPAEKNRTCNSDAPADMNLHQVVVAFYIL